MQLKISSLSIRAAGRDGLRRILGAGVALLGWSAWGQAQEPAPAAEIPVTYEGTFHAETPTAGAPSIRAENPEEKGNLYNINMVVVVGDREEVYALPNWEYYENEALYQPMAEADIEAYRQRILKDLQDRGFIFATVSVYKPSLVQGFLKLRVHVGELGQVTVRGNRWHTAEQILRKIDWSTGHEFDYSTLFNRLYAINTNPGLEVQSQLRPRQEEGGRRVIDAEFTVKERFPMSFGLTLSNDGSNETSEWRMRLGVQWHNPLKRDDVLAVDWVTAPFEWDEVNAVAGNYVLPLGRKYKVSAFAGYSQSDLTNVLPQLDLLGKGYFLGAGVHRNLYDSARSSFDISLGWMFLNSENRTATYDPDTKHSASFELYGIDMSMPRLSLSWAAKDWDSLGGRNFLSNTILFNLSGTIGSSHSTDFANVSNNGDGDFVIDRFQFARFQKLWGNPEEIGSFSLYTRFDAQLATKGLPSTMQKVIGGADSVRGYFEGEFAGDLGYDLSLELRTPLLSNFIRGLQKSEEFLKENPNYWGMHRLQAVAFFDMGSVSLLNPLAGQEGGRTLLGVGGGLRATFTKYSQFRLDYGYPLKNTDNSPNDGRVHFAGQLQF